MVTGSGFRYGSASGESRFTRWILVVLPVGIMLAFYQAILLLARLLQQLPGIDPRVFAYLSFLSIVPPLILLVIWLLQRRAGDGPGLVITTRETLSRDIAIGLALVPPLVALFVGSLALLRWLGLPAVDFSAFTWQHHLFFSTIGAVVPGVAEEIYFRGLLFEKLRGLRPAVIILASSLSFAFWHVLSPPYLLHTFLVGLLLGITYHRFQRLLPVMVSHTLANATAGILIVSGYL